MFLCHRKNDSTFYSKTLHLNGVKILCLPKTTKIGKEHNDNTDCEGEVLYPDPSVYNPKEYTHIDNIGGANYGLLYDCKDTLEGLVIRPGKNQVFNLLQNLRKLVFAVDDEDQEFSVKDWEFDSSIISECTKLKSLSLPDIYSTLRLRTNTHLKKLDASNISTINELTFYNADGEQIDFSGLDFSKVKKINDASTGLTSVIKNVDPLTGETLPIDLASFRNIEFIGKKALVGQTLSSLPKYNSENKTIDFSSLYLGERAFENTTLPVDSSTRFFLPQQSVVPIYLFHGSKLNGLNFQANSDITTIGSYAFADTSNFTLDSSVTAFASGVFKQSSDFEITNTATVNIYSSFQNASNFILNSNISTITDESFLNASNFTINGNIATINFSGRSGAFSNAKNFTINGSVSVIGNRAFSDARNISIRTLGATISIGDFAFSGNDYSGTGEGRNVFAENSIFRNLDLTICPNLTSVGVGAFSTTNMISVRIPSGITFNDSTTGAGTFSYNQSLTTVSLEGTTSVVRGMFTGCTSLTNLSISQGLQVIGKEGFRGCSSLSTVSLPDGVQRIKEFAFYDCTNLSSVTIPTSVAMIEQSAFGNTIIQNVTLGSNTKYIKKVQSGVFTEDIVPSFPNNTTVNGGKPYYYGKDSTGKYYQEMRWYNYDNSTWYDYKPESDNGQWLPYENGQKDYQ